MKKLLLLLLLLLIFQVNLFSQIDYRQKSTSSDANYFEIVKNTRSYFKSSNNKRVKKSRKFKKQKKHFERWAYYWKDRVAKDGSFPSETLGYYNAGILDAAGKIVNQKKSRRQKLSAETWVNIGPQKIPEANGYPNFPQLGRLNTFLRIKHPSDRAQDVLFVGAPSGGIWKSTNNGTTWSPKLDVVAGIGVTDIKTASTTTFANYTIKPIYVSTGDYDAGQIKSIGVLKSTDGGETFTSTGLSHTLSERKRLGEMVVFDDNTVLVGENQYIKKTVDGGANWTNLYDSGTNASFGRVAFSGTNIMYSGAFDVFFSSDSGVNWTIPIVSNDSNKHAVTVGSDGDFYVQNLTGQIKKYNIGAGTFSNVGTVSAEYDPQGGFNQALLVRNGLIVSADVNGRTSSDNGVTWYRSLNGYFQNDDGLPVEDHGVFVHSDHHGLGMLDGQYEFWNVNDGGLNFVTYSSANDETPTNEYKSNGVINSQLYDVAITPNASTGNYIMALQDNDGFSREMHNGSMQWIAAAAGDGVCAVINYNNPSIRYLGSQKGGLTKVGNGFSGNVFGNGDAQINGADFVWPLEIHTTDPTILYAGGDDVYKITDPNAGANLATSVASATNLNSGAGGMIQKITTHGSGIAAIGDSAKLSVNSGTSWTTIANPAGVTINSVDFNQSTMNIIYCTVSGYTDGSKIFKSTDSGATWTNISTGLPNVLMKEVVLKQNQGTEILFAGTELGVYFKNGDKDWSILGQTLPNVIVNDIDINYTEDKLVAATFGRGLWHINIANSTLGIEDKEVLNSKLNIFPNPVIKGKFKFKVNDKYSNFKYKIFNVLGGVVLEGESNSSKGEVNVRNLNNGIYMFKTYIEGVNSPSVKIIVSNK
ncbi:putative secreted protein (Por secretion system target) [Lutibacter sp. Hel_I_33_5]|uniref:T9SS type A sorting domain-containing protein n=1 Tax=Lutibacter sp. Hel_I_33_5 TaxID=1566289 RepID=UPI0011A7DC4E|nr:T9SS type A sorting domain-containing protein [Lutibacter sp. Hel_I_33_5]TVZ56713.1 putative secreted protein (Por secretion system target) [Lutibacter sp. Hel_I_33_5]